MRFYPLSHRLTGGDVHYTVKKGDTLGLIASHYGLERTDLAIQTHTNPSFKVAHIWVGEVLKFSNRHIVPYSMSNGLLLNVAQRMLFDFKDGQLLEAYPFAAGVPTWPTPIGMFHITSKVAFPVWYVPKNIQEEEASEGRVVQIKVLPGPDNPLGQYWLGLSVGGIGIHGTIEPQNIYRYESHGCVRLFPSDIKKLFGQSYVGESGEIIYEPVLLAKSRDGKIWLEVDDDVYNLWPYHDLNYVKALIRKNHLEHEVSWKKVDQVVRQKLAVAENVTNRLPKEIVANKNR
ncbi:MAG: L,D-transpeptidase family protein [Proteobacteria bacterium]|nr:L,D-transpeptidase family protein [Pseudomonadota bacterium]